MAEVAREPGTTASRVFYFFTQLVTGASSPSAVSADTTAPGTVAESDSAELKGGDGSATMPEIYKRFSGF